MRKLLIAALAALLPFTVGAACLGDHEGDNDDHYAYWKDVRGATWMNNYGECWRTINDLSYHNTLEEALACGDAEQAYTVVNLSLLVHFNFDKSDLLQSEIGRVRSVINELRKIQRDGGVIVGANIVGHTDSIGTDEYNMKLGMRRAKALAAFLKANGLDVNITTESRGESEPVSANDIDRGRAANRRAEAVIPVEIFYIIRK